MEDCPAGSEASPTPGLPALRVWADAEPRAAALNMALDEILLRHAAESPSSPILRFYGWARPAVSFGYFDRWEVVRARFPSAAEWVRRWTGGGAVDHAADLTFALCLPAREPLAAQPSGAIYRAVHAALAAALRDTGAPDARLADGRDVAPPVGPGSPPPCFVAPVCADVLAGGRKVAGGAQRRARAGVLHQGSVQGLGRAAPGEGFRAAFARRLAGCPTPWAPPAAWLEEARALAAERYATAGWNERR